jgi:hypothetical protein
MKKFKPSVQPDQIHTAFVALIGVGDQPEGPAGTQLHVGDMQAPINAAHDQAFFARVELDGFA